MKTNKRVSLFGLAFVIVIIAVATECATAANTSDGVPWSVQVERVDSGDGNLSSSFQIAIYESLIAELNKTKQFKQVLREGDRNATEVSNLLILKTTIQKYTPGSETRRAVTTFGGATKLSVSSQLVTRDGQIILERKVDGTVRFMGSNLKATHNLAHNVAKTIKQTSLTAPSQPAPAPTG